MKLAKLYVGDYLASESILTFRFAVLCFRLSHGASDAFRQNHYALGKCCVFYNSIFVELDAKNTFLRDKTTRRYE